MGSYLKLPRFFYSGSSDTRFGATIGIVKTRDGDKLFSLKDVKDSFFDIFERPYDFFPRELLNSENPNDKVFVLLSKTGKFADHLFYEDGIQEDLGARYYRELESMLLEQINKTAFDFSISQEASIEEDRDVFPLNLDFILNACVRGADPYYRITIQAVNLDGRGTGYTLDRWWDGLGDMNDDWDIVIEEKNQKDTGFFSSFTKKMNFGLSKILRRSLIKKIHISGGNLVRFEYTGGDYEMEVGTGGG